MQQNDWKEIEEDFNKHFGYQEGDSRCIQDILDFFCNKFTEVFEEGKKVGRDEVLSQIKGLGARVELDLIEVANVLNKLR